MDNKNNSQRECPLISIIVPVYNVSSYLSRCIDSILQQSYSRFECLLIDDGSNDESSALCDYYTSIDSRVSSIHKVNGGVSDARNMGIELAIGQHIVFCDSDDCVYPGYLESLVKCQDDHKEAFIVCGYNKVFKDSDKKAYVYDDQSKVSSLQLSEYMLLFNKELIQTPYCKLFQTSVIKKNRISFDTQFSLGEDISFILNYLRALVSQSIVVLNEPLYNYYQNGDNALSVKYRPDLLEIYDRVYSAINEHIIIWDNEKRYIDIFYRQRFNHYIIAFHSIMRDENDQKKHEKFKSINRVIRTKEFKKALLYMKGRMNRLIYFAYQCGYYQLVCRLERLASLIR